MFSNARSFDTVYPFETAPAAHGSVRVCYRYIIMMQKKEQLNFSRKNGKTLLAVELNSIITTVIFAFKVLMDPSIIIDTHCLWRSLFRKKKKERKNGEPIDSKFCSVKGQYKIQYISSYQ